MAGTAGARGSGAGAVDLDNGAVVGAHDPAGMRALIEGLPDQLGEAWRAGFEWELPASYGRPSRVLVAGVGGSAIGADVVGAVALERSTVPVQVVRGYEIPPLDDGTLLVGCSFSGNTAETRGALEASAGGPGMRLVLTTGGALGELAATHRWPVLRYAFGGPPRSALGWGALPLLAILARLGAVDVDSREVADLALGLRRAASGWTPEVSGEGNLAKQLARGVAGRRVLVIGAGPLEVTARRWAAQLNENAKQWAVAAALPESNHNLIVPLARGGAVGDDAGSQPLVVLIDGTGLDPRVRRQVQLTARTLEEAGTEHEVVSVGGRGALESILEGCVLGDWVSWYAAALNQVDPMNVEALDRFKSRLAGEGGA